MFSKKLILSTKNGFQVQKVHIYVLKINNWLLKIFKPNYYFELIYVKGKLTVF